MLSKRHVHDHHDDKADDSATRRDFLIATLGRLGDEIIHDDKDHGTGGKSEGIWQQWLDIEDCPRS